MRRVTHREMRNNSGEILRAVAASESIEITNNGQVAAVIGPPTRDAMAELIDRGDARAPRATRGTLSSIVRATSHSSTADIIEDVRGRW